MSSEPQPARPNLEDYRDYLHLLARLHLGGGGRVDASDIVQQTLLEAHARLDQFHGQGESALAAWLRQVLAHNLADAFRALHRAKRDVSRECSLEAELAASSAQMGAWLAAPHSSPSERAQRNEHAVLLARALAQLPEPQREAVVLRHLEGCSLAEIASRLGRTPAAVVGLLQRGLAQLRTLLPQENDPC